MQTPEAGKKNARAKRAGKELNESLNILNIGEEHTMRKSMRAMWVLLAAVIFAVCAPYAHADAITNGTINFTVRSGNPDATGSFVYDSTTSSFSSFTVDWDGVVYNYATSGLTLAHLGSSGSWCAIGPTNTSGLCAPDSFFLAETASGPEAPATFTNPSAFAAGSYSVTETTASTPEPSSLLLMLLGLGALVFVMDRRRRQLLSPTGTE